MRQSLVTARLNANYSGLISDRVFYVIIALLHRIRAREAFDVTRDWWKLFHAKQFLIQQCCCGEPGWLAVAFLGLKYWGG